MSGATRVWSLWDLVNSFALRKFLHYFTELSACHCYLASEIKRGNGSHYLTIGECEKIQSCISGMSAFFNESGLPECERICIEHGRLITPAMLELSAARAYLDGLMVHVQMEFRDHEMLRISKDRSGFLEKDALFGEGVADAFPSAQRDITEAGNCLAAECNTACVFHLMRAAEVGLRALAIDRNLSFKNKPLEDTEWGRILNTLEGDQGLKKLRDANRNLWPSSEARESQIRFYNAAAQELRSFNDIWRRHVSHADENAFYDRHQALSVFEHVRLLLQKLATRISESRSTPEYWTEP